MSWTHFWDMHSGGRQKLDWHHVFIEAPLDEAQRIFEERFGRDPTNVTCSCCGPDYSVSECATLEEATAYHRGCAYDDEAKGWVERLRGGRRRGMGRGARDSRPHRIQVGRPGLRGFPRDRQPRTRGERRMRLDGKVRLEGGKLIQNKDGREVPEDEFIVFRPHDNAVPGLLNVYRTMCVDLGADRAQLEALDGLIGRVHLWRMTHPERCKVPDVEPGEIQTE